MFSNPIQESFGLPAQSSFTCSRQRSVSLLMDSFHDLGMEEVSLADLGNCPESVVALMWKLVSERQRDLRYFAAEKEHYAKIANDNKLLKVKATRLTDEQQKMRAEIAELELRNKRVEEDMLEKLDSVQRNRKYVFGFGPRFNLLVVNGRNVHYLTKGGRRSSWPRYDGREVTWTSFRPFAEDGAFQVFLEHRRLPALLSFWKLLRRLTGDFPITASSLCRVWQDGFVIKKDS